jgi:hypothetical protein
MAAARLLDSQKQELVRRFRQGESTQALAVHYGCSTTTITRMVRAEMGPEAYAAIKDQRQRGGRDRQIALAIDSDRAPDAAEQADLDSSSSASESAAAREDQLSPTLPSPDTEVAPTEIALPPPPASPSALVDTLDTAEEESTVLAIDDADDFAAAGEGDEDDLIPGEDEAEDDVPLDMDDFHPVAVLPIAVDDQRETLPAPWSPDALPPCAYLLVDKTVELQAQPLAEIPELGRLPSGEQERQALVLFTNPRQAKRHCGRTQRVIKLPDPAVVGRTAPYLLAQGISRVVIEGTLYALPDH